MRAPGGAPLIQAPFPTSEAVLVLLDEYVRKLRTCNGFIVMLLGLFNWVRIDLTLDASEAWPANLVLSSASIRHVTVT